MMLIGLDKSGQKSDIYHTARQERRKPKGEWRVAEAKWLFSVHFVWKNTDFPLCPCGFWRFCYHGVITISLYLSTYLYLYYLKMVSIVEHTLN